MTIEDIPERLRRYFTVISIGGRPIWTTHPRWRHLTDEQFFKVLDAGFPAADTRKNEEAS